MSSEEGHHLVPFKYYLGVFVALVVLTVVTVYTAKYVDLGIFNFALAMLIAGAKALLVMSIFMGLRWDATRSNITALLVTFFFFFIFVAILMADYTTRDTAIEIEAAYDEETRYSPVVKGATKSEIRTNFMSFSELKALRQSLIDGEVPEEILKAAK